MNAQEAIEIIKEKQRRLQVYLSELSITIHKQKLTDSQNIKLVSDLEKEIEALSVVLESAKLLHESGVKVSQYHSFRVLSASVEVEDPTDELIKSIGIEEGADE